RSVDRPIRVPARAPRPPLPRRIRWDRYYIGRGEQNLLAEDMNQAVNYLSQELYSRDVHFQPTIMQFS
uniref:Uncharacterized protein n=1 Tax=Aegilops tauschii subsp. strangulata TaxID=200361 RepID=A0A453PY62_AEGTS